METRGEDLSRYSNKIQPVCLGKCPHANKAYLIDITVENISKIFTHNMAPETNWHRYGTKLRHRHVAYV